MLGGMALSHGAGSLLLALAPFAGSYGVEIIWTTGWLMWAAGDLLTPPFIAEILRSRLEPPDDRSTLASAAKALAWPAAMVDLVLNVIYATSFDPPAVGTSFFPGPFWRLLSLGLANGLFLACYLLLSVLLWRRRAVPMAVTLVGLVAWAGAAGLSLPAFGRLGALQPIFAAVFTIGFLGWLATLWRAESGGAARV